MIVQFPTGLYRTVLPSEPDDSGNITFTISNSSPPRTNLLFPKVPRGIVDRKRNVVSLDPVQRREFLGELVFSVSRSDKTEEGNNARQFEIGQILEFSDTPLQTLDPMYVADETETRHDTNLFDYDAIGLDEDEQRLIADNSVKVQQRLTDELNIARSNRSDAEEIVNIKQKLINETNRNINALEVIVTNSDDVDPDVSALIEKLTAKRDAAIADRDVAIDNANTYASEASRLLDELRTVATVVK